MKKNSGLIAQHSVLCWGEARTRILCLSLIIAMAVAGAIAEAQQPKKILRIGYLSPFAAATESARSEPFRLALRELGYIEGQNVAIDYRDAEGKDDRFPELAAELCASKLMSSW